MGKFRFRADCEFVTWVGKIYEIEAESKEEALEKLKKYNFAIFSMEADGEAELVEPDLPSPYQDEFCNDDRVIIEDAETNEWLFDGYI